MGSRIGRLMICGLLAFATVATACSSDDDGGSSTTSTTSTTNSSDSSTSTDDGSGSTIADWCNAARAASNAVPSERLALTEDAADLVPDELRDDYDALVDFLRYQDENPTDAVGLAERTEALSEPFQRIAASLQADCGITTNLGG